MSRTYAIDVRLGERRAERVTVNLGEVEIALRLRWLPRLQRWSAIFETAAGERLTPQLVIEPGADVPIDTTLPDAPSGRLSWRGPDSYRRRDLGRSLVLLWQPEEVSA